MLCFTADMARATAIREADLQRWKLIAPFHEVLAQAVGRHPLAASWQDPKRLLQYGDYLSLFLFALLNPVVDTMQGLCQASHLERVQRQVGTRPVSLGSFSEAQHFCEPALLEEVFTSLAAQVPTEPSRAARLRDRPWLVVDSTLWAALPRMGWAVWRHQDRTQRAVRLHLGFHLLDDSPVRATVTAGKRCERAVWQQQWQTGDCYVGDRNYGEDYQLLRRLEEQDCSFVLRLRDSAVWAVAEQLALTEADRAARVLRQAWVRLGAGTTPLRVRLVWVQTPREVLLLATNRSDTDLPAELVAQLYRWRWQVELFFRWIKCILGQRHWLAESAPGVKMQLYLALIAAVLLQLYTGRRPNKRMMELIQWYLLGWASVAELSAGLERELARINAKKRN